MSRPRKKKWWSNQFNEFFEQFEAKRKDAPHSGYERDMFYNYLCIFGFSDTIMEEWAKRLQRSLKGTDRQRQLVLYIKEPNNIIDTYKNSGYRIWRGGERFGAWDKEVMRCHLKDGVLLHFTAEILQRTVEELKKYRNRLGPGGPEIKGLVY